VTRFERAQKGEPVLTTIPFSGFYDTIHDAQINDCLESMLSDSSGCRPASDRISEKMWMHTSTPMLEYTSAFVVSFQTLLNGESGLSIKLEWESVSSPREYNFATDRIFAKISFPDVQAIFNKVNKKVLDKTAHERFTSCSGFISHYSPDWRDWGSLHEWDHNQIGTILEALVSEFFSSEWEWDVIEDWSGNGCLDNWIYDNLDTEGKRLLKLADYLRDREERKYRAA
jgi:hypothetical protein